MPLRIRPGLRPLLVLALTTAAGCGSDDDSGGGGGADAATSDAAAADAGVDAAAAPVFRNPVDLPDDQLADAVLKLLDAPVADATESCSRCHGMGRQTLRYWRALGDESLDDCLTSLEVADPAAARVMIDCLRDDPDDPESMFKAEKLGVYSIGAHLPWFAHLFELAYGAEAPDAHQAFVDQLGMPRGGAARFEQDGFDLVAEYFDRGLPLLDEKLIEEPRPTECTAGVSEDVAAHVTAMSTQGWAAVNADNALLMHGCGGAPTPRDCLAGETREEEWELPGVIVRSLQTVEYRSSFWTRSSADGRFVAHGTKPNGSAFVDLQSGAVIDANAFYDPGFFPDNSGFAFQGSQALFCEHQVLTATPAPTVINFDEQGCTGNQEVGLYQHLGAALGGGDYWTVHGQFDSDDGGHNPTFGDPPATADQKSRLRLTPMIHVANTGFEAGTTVGLDTAWEGDAVLSPSALLVISRVSGAQGGQLGFVMRKVVATPTEGGYDVEVPEVARYCVNGGKPSFSFDERWLTYHHYVEAADAVELGFDGPEDPAFAPFLEQGAANLYVLDLLDGTTTRVTNMAPGEYALYPHFRSDGWIYFMVRDGTTSETIAATDAALVFGE